MDVRLLGEVEVRSADGSLVGLGSRQRAVLAVLVYRANAVVARSEIVRLAWGPRAEDWPTTVERLVADYVSHLRGALARAGAGAGAGVWLVARAPGFAADLDPQVVDCAADRVGPHQQRTRRPRRRGNAPGYLSRSTASGAIVVVTEARRRLWGVFGVLSEVLAGLAISASSQLVTAMVADGWLEVRTRVARLLGRGDPGEEARQEARLERAREEVIGGSGQEIDQVRERQTAAWRTRFEDLLEVEPEAAARLRELVEFLGQTGAAAAAGAVQVNAHASDHAQQAVQGQGVQTNTFTAPTRRGE
jgi:DNA-binding SARP family transcriptional activator